MISNVAAGTEAFTSNAFLVAGERTVLVDAGSEFDVVSAIEEHTGSVDAVVLTHAHHDHVGNVPALRDAFGVDVWGYDADHEAVDREFADGDAVQLGDHEYDVLHTPGHAPDHCCLYAPEPSICFSGDLVFPNGSFGRTDLPGADRRTLVESIDRLLDVVDEDLAQLHVGHGSSVTEDAYEHVDLAARAARSR